MSQTLLIHILGSADTHQLITRCLAKTNLSHKVVHIDPTDYLDYLEKNIKAPSDVLFVDNESEEVSSIKLIYELRQQIKTPIIFLTKRENKSLIKSAFKKGAAYYLVKCDLEANLLEHAIYYATQNIEHAKIIQEVTNRYDMILNTVDEGLVELDLQGKVTFMNASAEYTLGWKRTELIGKHISNFYGLAHQNKNKRAWKTHPIYFSAKDSKSYECYEATFKCLDERKIKVKYTSAPIIINGELENILLVFKNITQEVQSEAQLQYLARHDTLTGLYNRSEFNNHLTNAIERAKRSSTEIALLFIDLDRFKTVNDSLGHEVGDELLSTIAMRLTKILRKSDFLARLGGDKFTIVLEGNVSAKRASRVANRIIEEVGKPAIINGQKLSVSASIGIALYPSCAEDSDTLIKHADLAMYSAKRDGKATYRYYTLEFNKDISERMVIENELKNAISKNELQVVYEPRVCFKTQKMVGSEAVINWENELIGNVDPVVFMPIAEESGVLKSITAWAINECCQQVKKWEELKLGQIPISINLPINLLKDVHFIQFIKDCLNKYNINRKILTLELLESTLMAKPDEIIHTLDELHQAGINILIDHFGSGYSYLSYLRDLPIDTIKIDKSLITEVDKNHNSAVIVNTIINLAHNLDIKVVAEDVENIEQFNFLKKHGCDEGEGKYFGYTLNKTIFSEFVGIRKKYEKKGFYLNKWNCLVCDYIYHEEQGIPAKGIPPGTEWSQLPSSWSCPDCSATKFDFESISNH